MSSDNCDDCKDFERELEHAKIQIQTLERLVEGQKDQIDHLREVNDKSHDQFSKVMMELQRTTLELNARLLNLIEKALLAPRS